MKPNALSFFSGLLFGAGLWVSGMAIPAKVIGFLDFAGAWDPSLMFVMAGAIAVHFVLMRIIRRRETPLFGAFQVPTRSDITTRLVLGAAIFGVGWGVGGYCPGPAIVSLGNGSLSAFIFVATMALGMVVQHVTDSGEPTMDT